jgi:hypothetical protein
MNYYTANLYLLCAKGWLMMIIAITIPLMLEPKKAVELLAVYAAIIFIIVPYITGGSLIPGMLFMNSLIATAKSYWPHLIVAVVFLFIALRFPECRTAQQSVIRRVFFSTGCAAGGVILFALLMLGSFLNSEFELAKMGYTQHLVTAQFWIGPMMLTQRLTVFLLSTVILFLAHTKKAVKPDVIAG